MAKQILIALILAEALMFRVMSHASAQAASEPTESSSMDIPPISTPQAIKKRDNGKANMTWELLRHRPESPTRASSTTQDWTIAKSPVRFSAASENQSQDHHDQDTNVANDQAIPIEPEKGGIRIAEGPAPINRRLGKHHHSVDKSIAGGGVIIGGLATTFIVSIICYIRATRRKTVLETTFSGQK
ncbi:hypothetical protein Scep_015870 [Stephania cephalantha]|uniref:Uncharacterized protein n=1 Tax=Stephania cephalantha TaxID=152367 RepID=A0AAP0J404_9MAGN